MKKVNITEEFLSKLAGPEPIKDKITGKDLLKGDFQHDWQEFVSNRQNNLDEKLNIKGVSSAFFEADSQLHVLLEQVTNGDDDLLHRIYADVFSQQDIVSYASYNKGFLEGIKFAMMIGQL